MKTPDWQELPLPQLVDAYGRLDLEIKALEARQSDMGAKLLLNLEQAGGRLLGPLFVARKQAGGTRVTVSRTKLEADIGEAAARKYLNFSTVRDSVRVELNQEAKTALLEIAK